jgi:hypothetical protein
MCGGYSSIKQVAYLDEPQFSSGMSLMMTPSVEAVFA